MSPRRILPQRRQQMTVSTVHKQQRFEVSFGLFDDGTPAEVFISATKPGGDFHSLANDAAVVLSLALQHGVPLLTIRNAMAREENGRPQSIVGAVVDAFANEVA